jgi:hypothetical protein
MNTPFTLLAALAASTLVGIITTPAPAAAQATPFLPLAGEPPAKLIVEPPIPDRLAHGAVLIPTGRSISRILPVFGTGADDVSPRAGHLHVTVDDLPWHWADAGDNHTVVVVGLPPGRHKVLLELATPSHAVLTGQAVAFDIPADAYAAPATHAH